MDVNKSTIHIGASGYSYDDWVGPVYPSDIKKEDMLHYYANELGFDTVELNYTYYTQPTARVMDAMLKRVTEGFRFVVKAHGSMTHKIRDDQGAYIRDETVIETFLEGIKPLVENGSLACVLAQFPYKFQKNADTMEHLRWFAESMQGVKLVLEFRHQGWVSQTAFDLLKDIGVGFCVVDEPPLANLMPFLPVVTASPAYFRFHGRNKRWFGVPTEVRYDYLYDDVEIQSFIAPVRKLAVLAEETYIFFNNHFQGSAIKNANRLKEMLEMNK